MSKPVQKTISVGTGLERDFDWWQTGSDELKAIMIGIHERPYARSLPKLLLTNQFHFIFSDDYWVPHLEAYPVVALRTPKR